jgi:hypothetical protein
VAGVHIGLHLSVSEVSIQTSHSVPEIPFIDHVVPLEHTHGFVSCDGHNAKVIDPGLPSIRHEGMSKVVKRRMIDACVATGPLKCQG